MAFRKLQLIEPILRALETEGYTIPTPIQQEAIPVLLAGRDLLGCAQTGTGKTAAFAIPILQLLYNNRPNNQGPKPIRSLILTPTRELAVQIGESFAAYGKHTGLKHTVIFGGVSQHSQVEALRRGVDIVVATPGRLLDLINQRHVNLQHIKMFVLDEADRMLDMGFIEDIKSIVARLPQRRQNLFFSATMPPVIRKLADNILHEPVYVEVTPVSSTVDTISQSMFFVSKANKKALLLHLMKDKSITRALIFTRTKHGADKVTRSLMQAGVKAAAIHGNKSQNARQTALNGLKESRIRILVATDIAARGIDVDNLTHVINYELPEVPETYVHRIGRTGRAGANGIAISFCDAEEKSLLRDIQKLIAKQIPVNDQHPYPLSAVDVAIAEQPQYGNNKRSSSGNNRSRNSKRRGGGGRSGNRTKPSGADNNNNSGQAKATNQHKGQGGNNNKPSNAQKGGGGHSGSNQGSRKNKGGGNWRRKGR